MINYDEGFLKKCPSKSVLRIICGTSKRKISRGIVVDGVGRLKVESRIWKLNGNGRATRERIAERESHRGVEILQLIVHCIVDQIHVSILIIDQSESCFEYRASTRRKPHVRYPRIDEGIDAR